MLDDHVIPWIRQWKFGMGVMGEQWGESCHREFKRLHRVFHGIPDPLTQLTSVMKEHIIATHPKINKFIVLPRKRKLSI